MAEIIIGEKVINKFKQVGTIVSVDNTYIGVDFGNRIAKLQLDAFDKGFLKYKNADLQSVIDKGIQQIKEEKDQEAEKKRLVEEQAKNLCKMMEAQAPAGTKFNSVSIRLDPAPASFSSVKSKHKKLVQEIFSECDKDINFYYDSFHPNMKYIIPRNYSFSYDNPEYLRSKYCVGFLAKYANVYVLRVISRNDIYLPSKFGGGTVTNSDITEIIRILYMNGEIYYFSKNLSFEYGNYKNSTLYKKWQASSYIGLLNLDEVIRTCDCKYLNDYIHEKDVNCLAYVRLLMPALYNSKAEIVFKNRRFASTVDIDNIVDYLQEFSPKQIDFASKNNVIKSLPIIKRCGVFDVDILLHIEPLMKKGRNERSIYDTLKQLFALHNFDLSTLDKKLIVFLRKTGQDFRAAVYEDYIRELARLPALTVDDIFDKDYIDRHYVMMQEKRLHYSTETSNEYIRIAQELSWIDREENGYYITIPKSIPEFQYEGQMQHHCVYTMGYFCYVIERQSIIVFLRQEKDKPYVTIEFDYETFDVLQAYKKFNQNVDKELYQYIVNLGKQLKLERLAHE